MNSCSAGAAGPGAPARVRALFSLIQLALLPLPSSRALRSDDVELDALVVLVVLEPADDDGDAADDGVVGAVVVVAAVGDDSATSDEGEVRCEVESDVADEGAGEAAKAPIGCGERRVDSDRISSKS